MRMPCSFLTDCITFQINEGSSHVQHSYAYHNNYVYFISKDSKCLNVSHGQSLLPSPGIVHNSLPTVFSVQTIHSWWGVTIARQPGLATALELSHILPKDISSAESRDQVIKLSLCIATALPATTSSSSRQAICQSILEAVSHLGQNAISTILPLHCSLLQLKNV